MQATITRMILSQDKQKRNMVISMKTKYDKFWDNVDDMNYLLLGVFVWMDRFDPIQTSESELISVFKTWIQIIQTKLRSDPNQSNYNSVRSVFAIRLKPPNYCNGGETYHGLIGMAISAVERRERDKWRCSPLELRRGTTPEEEREGGARCAGQDNGVEAATSPALCTTATHTGDSVRVLGLVLNLTRPKIRSMKLRKAHKNNGGSSYCTILWDLTAEHIVTASSDASISIHDALLTSNTPRILRNHRDGVTTLALSPNSTCLASGSNDRSVKLYKFPGGEFESNITGFTLPIRALSFNRSGTMLAAGGDDDGIKLINTIDGSRVR
ncbi:hypothetical protein LXL04_026812 [Taraxacum kok-saghyz]